ncbi:MAG: hypothetical protein HRU20_21665 [Pseudomonadales bacterium]|nr:hypothetical protein [Pseudomonadales bacterium]
MPNSQLDYSQILSALKSASDFDLYRLRCAIDKETDDPIRIQKLRQQLSVGQELSYFDAIKNALIPCRITKLNPKKVAIKELESGKGWLLEYCMLNIDQVDAHINQHKPQGLDRHSLSVGDAVGFEKEGQLIYGQVARLNDKTVTLNCQGHKWRVAYVFLHQVIDAKGKDDFIQGSLSGSAYNGSCI